MAHRHIWAIATGFGYRLIPTRAPHAFRLGPQPSQIDTKCFGDQPRFCRITPLGDHFRSDVDQNTSTYQEVVDIEEGPSRSEWWIETTQYRLPLPENWNAHCEGNKVQLSAFELYGPSNSIIFVQTPNNPPTDDAFVAAGQRVRAQGQSARGRWIELDYVHDNQTWFQRHEWFQLGRMNAVVTLQALAADAESLQPTFQKIVHAIERSRTN